MLKSKLKSEPRTEYPVRFVDRGGLCDVAIYGALVMWFIAAFAM